MLACACALGFPVIEPLRARSSLLVLAREFLCMLQPSCVLPLCAFPACVLLTFVSSSILVRAHAWFVRARARADDVSYFRVSPAGLNPSPFKDPFPVSRASQTIPAGPLPTAPAQVGQGEGVSTRVRCRRRFAHQMQPCVMCEHEHTVVRHV